MLAIQVGGIDPVSQSISPVQPSVLIVDGDSVGEADILDDDHLTLAAV